MRKHVEWHKARQITMHCHEHCAGTKKHRQAGKRRGRPSRLYALVAIEARSSKTLWIALVAIEAPLNNTAYMNMNCCAFVHTLEWHYLSCIYAICICICTCERVRAIDQGNHQGCQNRGL